MKSKCEYCGELFYSCLGRRCCSNDCRKKFYQKKEPEKCKDCGKIISGKRGRKNKSGYCYSCFMKRREDEAKAK